MRVVVFLDMDGVLADFDAGVGKHCAQDEDPPQMFEPGFYRNLPVIVGAKEAVQNLLQIPLIDLQIATKPTTKNLHCATEKYQWVEEHFPQLLRKMTLTHDKSLLLGDVLVDDDSKWELGFLGEFYLFDGTKPKDSWDKAQNFIFDTMKKIIAAKVGI